MKTLFRGLAASALAVAVLGSGALAQSGSAPVHKQMEKATVTLKCPSCHMPMPTKASKMFPVPVKVKGTTYYCCTQCDSGKKAMKANAKSAKKAPAKGAASGASSSGAATPATTGTPAGGNGQ